MKVALIFLVAWMTIPLTGTHVQAEQILIAIPSSGGAVAGSDRGSDEFIWRLFVDFVAPASPSDPSSPSIFETWASDHDLYNQHPAWPAPTRQIDLQASVLAANRSPATSEASIATANGHDEPCLPPPGAAVGDFPTIGTPAPCIAEQVGRNRSLFDYLVRNRLNTQAGLADAYNKSFNVDPPEDAIAIKADWVPVKSLLLWIPSLKGPQDVRDKYHLAKVDGIEYGLVSLHVSSKKNSNWVWGTFEHQLNPGRCDYIGCYDAFGADTQHVFPNKLSFNSTYGACTKSTALSSLMAKVGLSTKWNNYCLKATQTDFSSPDGTPYALGNSVIEGLVGNGTVASSSCITCHSYASFASDGKPTQAAKAILPFNPTGGPLTAVTAGALPYSFMWGVLKAP